MHVVISEALTEKQIEVRRLKKQVEQLHEEIVRLVKDKNDWMRKALDQSYQEHKTMGCYTNCTLWNHPTGAERP